MAKEKHKICFKKKKKHKKKSIKNACSKQPNTGNLLKRR